MSTALAPIKKWTTRHEMVVHLHIAQYSNTDIAEKMKITPVRVSQILSDPQAKQIVRAVQKNLRKQMEDSIEDRLLVLADEGVARIEETITHRDFVLGTDAKKHQDRLSFDVVKGLGFLPGDKEGERVAEKKLPAALAERLVTALEASNAASRAQNQEIMEAEVVEDVV